MSENKNSNVKLVTQLSLAAILSVNSTQLLYIRRYLCYSAKPVSYLHLCSETHVNKTGFYFMYPWTSD